MALPDEAIAAFAQSTAANRTNRIELVFIPPTNRTLIRGDVYIARLVPELVMGPDGREEPSGLKCCICLDNDPHVQCGFGCTARFCLLCLREFQKVKHSKTLLNNYFTHL